jgi:hypothetical protein
LPIRGRRPPRFRACLLGWLGPSGLGGDHIGGLFDSKPVGVDTQGAADHGVLQGVGVRCRAGGDPEQVHVGLSSQRVARLRPAAPLSAVHDPPLQFISSGMQSA